MKSPTNSKSLILTLSTIFALIQNSVSEKSKIDLKSFEGNWEGEGTYYLPFTSIPTSVDARASFEYDYANKSLRTAVSAERFLLKYSDSGKLAYGNHHDSLNWEIWNSFGYHVQYSGGIKGKTIHGKRRWGKYVYDLFVDIVNNDSLKIKITSTDDEGESTEIANGYLRRTKDEKD